MKTVIQEIIDKYYQSSIYRCEFTEWLLENKHTLLEKEKKQIIDAHLEGWGDAYDYLKDDFLSPRQAEDYYNETYNQNDQI